MVSGEELKFLFSKFSSERTITGEMIIVDSLNYRVKVERAEQARADAARHGLPVAQYAGAAVRYFLRRMRRRGNWNLLVEFAAARQWKGKGEQLSVQLSSAEAELIDTVCGVLGTKINIFIEAAIAAYPDALKEDHKEDL